MLFPCVLLFDIGLLLYSSTRALAGNVESDAAATSFDSEGWLRNWNKTKVFGADTNPSVNKQFGRSSFIKQVDGPQNKQENGVFWSKQTEVSVRNKGDRKQGIWERTKTFVRGCGSAGRSGRGGGRGESGRGRGGGRGEFGRGRGGRGGGRGESGRGRGVGPGGKALIGMGRGGRGGKEQFHMGRGNGRGSINQFNMGRGNGIFNMGRGSINQLNTGQGNGQFNTGQGNGRGSMDHLNMGRENGRAFKDQFNMGRGGKDQFNMGRGGKEQFKMGQGNRQGGKEHFDMGRGGKELFNMGKGNGQGGANQFNMGRGNARGGMKQFNMGRGNGRGGRSCSLGNNDGSDQHRGSGGRTGRGGGRGQFGRGISFGRGKSSCWKGDDKQKYGANSRMQMGSPSSRNVNQAAAIGWQSAAGETGNQMRSRFSGASNAGMHAEAVGRKRGAEMMGDQSRSWGNKKC